MIKIVAIEKRLKENTVEWACAYRAAPGLEGAAAEKNISSKNYQLRAIRQTQLIVKGFFLPLK